MSEDTQDTATIRSGEPVSAEKTVSLNNTPHENDYISDEELNGLMTEQSNSLADYGELTTIGMGGMGTIMSGLDPKLGREVAIKVLRPQNRNRRHFLARFIREARTTAQIEHPNIVPVHDFGIFNDAGIYFTMKKVVGENLRTIIFRTQTGDPEYTRKYTTQLFLEILIATCNALAFAHSRGLVHRDLKPSNIMIGDFGEVQVMDWGLVKYLNGKDNDEIIPQELGTADNPMSTSDGIITGTPAFMSPEQAAGIISDVDERSDIYSLGCIMYSMLTLEESPVTGGNSADILAKVRCGQILPPRKRAPKHHIPKELEAICLKAMAYNKDKRYQSVNDLIQDIRNYMANYPVVAYPIPFYSRVFKFFRRHPLVPSVLLVATVTMFGLWGLEQIDASARSVSYLRLADSHMLNGDLAMLRARNIYHNIERYRHEQPINQSGDYLEMDLARQVIEFNNYYDQAADLLKRAEGASAREEIEPFLANIFIKRLRFSIETRNFNETRKLLGEMRSQRRGIFYSALAADENLDNQVRMVRQNTGLLSIYASPDMKVSFAPLPLRGYKPVQPEDFQVLPEPPFNNHKLSAGAYLLRVESPDSPVFHYPVYIGICDQEQVLLSAPRKIPEQMVYVPAGTAAFRSDSDQSGSPVRIWRETPGFFISREAVTFDEYHRFWQQLASPELRDKYMPKWIKKRQFFNIFTENDDYLEGFSAVDPVSGITPEAAMAYCEWLGERRERKFTLPSLIQLRRASTGIQNYEWESGIFMPRNGAANGNGDTSDTSVFGMRTNPEAHEFIMDNNAVRIVNTLTRPVMQTVDSDETSFNLVGFRLVSPLD